MVSSAFHSTQAVVSQVAEDEPPLYKLGSKPVQAVCRERVELLIELFWEVRENKHLAEMPLPLAHFFPRSNSFGQRSLCTTASSHQL